MAGPDNSLKSAIIDLLVFLGLAIVYIIEAIIKAFLPTKYKDVRGQVVLVTGGGGGLGRLLCERFAKLGCKVVVWDINQKAVEDTVSLVKAQGGEAYPYICDITNREEVYKTAEDVKRKVGKVNILINNAGFVSGKPFFETPDSQIQKTFDVNIVSHFWTTKAFLPGMMDDGRGHVVTIASMAGFVGVTKLIDYCASKFACVGFDEALRLELETMGYDKIHLTAVCPYFISGTPMFDGVKTRFVPLVEVTEVADKVVNGVLTNQKRVYLPNYFKYMLFIRAIFPWSVYYMYLKTLVQDAHPESIHKRKQALASQIPEKIIPKQEKATENLQDIHRRITEIERQP